MKVFLKDAIFTLDDIEIHEDEFLSLHNLERLELPTIKKNTRINWKDIDFYDEDYDGY